MWSSQLKPHSLITQYYVYLCGWHSQAFLCHYVQLSRKMSAVMILEELQLTGDTFTLKLHIVTL